MNPCAHKNLELLPQRNKTLRCRHCHLTLASDDLQDGYCPECFDVSGARRYEFEEVRDAATAIVRYRCDDCGAIIESP